jgi:CubicO group peptidase (beta-lactamase class C family)
MPRNILKTQQLTHPVIEAELARLIDAGAVGFQVAATLDGQLVVNSWAGTVSAVGGPVDGETLFAGFGLSKPVVATAVHVQAERGFLEYDAPLAEYWPEFGSRGKNAITVAQVLMHRSGLPQMPAGVTPEIMCDWKAMTSALAELEPVFPPGTRSTYQAVSFGWLLGEVVRRTDPRGRSFGDFVYEEVCLPLGADSCYMGVPAGELHRVAELSSAHRSRPARDPNSLAERALPSQVSLGPAIFNRADVQQAGVPGTGVFTNAASMAAQFALLAGRGAVGGVRLLSEDRVLSFLTPRPGYDDNDEVFGTPYPIGAGGYWLSVPAVLDATTKQHRVLAHTGASSSIAWADLDTGIAVVICQNHITAPDYGGLADAVRLAIREGTGSGRVAPA